MSATQKTRMVITGRLKEFNVLTEPPADAPSERSTADMTIVFKKEDLKLFEHLFGEEHLLSVQIIVEKSSMVTL